MIVTTTNKSIHECRKLNIKKPKQGENFDSKDRCDFEATKNVLTRFKVIKLKHCAF